MARSWGRRMTSLSVQLHGRTGMIACRRSSWRVECSRLHVALGHRPCRPGDGGGGRRSCRVSAEGWAVDWTRRGRELWRLARRALVGTRAASDAASRLSTIALSRLSRFSSPMCGLGLCQSKGVEQLRRATAGLGCEVATTSCMATSSPSDRSSAAACNLY